MDHMAHQHRTTQITMSYYLLTTPRQQNIRIQVLTLADQMIASIIIPIVEVKGELRGQVMHTSFG